VAGRAQQDADKPSRFSPTALFFDEPGVLMTFEKFDEIGSDVASLGFNTQALVEAKKPRSTTCAWAGGSKNRRCDLEGLFVRLDFAIPLGQASVVLDTIESLFAGLRDDAILRSNFGPFTG
jgi:circadian clock protein KaiC